jgi:hypothetical protein
MISCTSGDNTSLFLFFSESPKCITSSSDLETSNVLEILSFEVNFCIVLFGKILRLGEWSMLDDSFAFSVRLVDGIGWYQF